MGSSQAAMSFLTNLARAAFGLGAAATLANSSLYTVDGGQRAVLFDRFRGVIDQTIGEGTHFLIPWLQKPFIFDIRTRPHTFSSISGTKDLQMVNLTLRVLSRPEANMKRMDAIQIGDYTVRKVMIDGALNNRFHQIMIPTPPLRVGYTPEALSSKFVIF
ncbi:hypothetical protein Pint_02915 [Pistacia integerrima]|uniref:Uncharacterized protein n=1 Tax=Pistacia integerrima TaxID=434235 RepID=A0ACC0ZH80_9ROSI|nr:hypothetical protein Pint_02915 [Pistacia integerrima]